MTAAQPLEQLLSSALNRVALLLPDVAQTVGKVTEDRLEQLLAEALNEGNLSEPVIRQAPAKIRDWPNVGCFDVKVGDAALELKWWGEKTSSRYETIWDACKLANAVDDGEASAGYLISGGARQIWGRDDGFTRLFGNGVQETIALCLPAANWWKSPANDNTTVPERLSTTFVQRVEFVLDDADYELRCARVAPAGRRFFVPRYGARPSKSAPVSDPSELERDLRIDRFAGTLLGGALGDALGAPVEFLALDEIRRKYGKNGIQDLAPAYGRTGAITDDTQMTLFTAEGLLRAHNRLIGKGIVHTPTMLRFAYLRWLHTQGRHDAWRAAFDEKPDGWPDGWLVSLDELHHQRAPGNTCLSGAASPTMGTIDEPLNQSKGCGAVMRAAPVGLAPLIDPFRDGCEMGALTHGHSSGYLAAGALALVVHRLVCGVDLENALDEAITRLRSERNSDECVKALGRGRELGRGHVTPERIEVLGGGWVAEEALGIAVCCALAAEDFLAGIRLAANHGGDSDSTAAITGNLLGAKWGKSALPEAWLNTLELRDAIEQVATDLARHHEDPEAHEFFDATMGDEERYPPW